MRHLDQIRRARFLLFKLSCRRWREIFCLQRSGFSPCDYLAARVMGLGKGHPEPRESHPLER